MLAKNSDAIAFCQLSEKFLLCDIIGAKGEALILSVSISQFYGHHKRGIMEIFCSIESYHDERTDTPKDFIVLEDLCSLT